MEEKGSGGWSREFGMSWYVVVFLFMREWRVGFSLCGGGGCGSIGSVGS